MFFCRAHKERPCAAPPSKALCRLLAVLVVMTVLQPLEWCVMAAEEPTDATTYYNKYNSLSTEQVYKQGLKEIQAGHMNEAMVCFTIAAGRYETALQTLRTLLQKQEEPVKILGGMGSQFRRLLAAKRLLDGGKRQQDLMKLCGINGYPAQKAMETAKRLSERFCARAVELCLEADEKLKTSYDTPERVLELLVLELAGESRNG